MNWRRHWTSSLQVMLQRHCTYLWYLESLYTLSVTMMNPLLLLKPRRGGSTLFARTCAMRTAGMLLGTSYAILVDLWSRGCILAKLFVHRPLFPGVIDIFSGQYEIY